MWRSEWLLLLTLREAGSVLARRPYSLGHARVQLDMADLYLTLCAAVTSRVRAG